MNWEPKKLPVDLLYCSGLELAVSLRSLDFLMILIDGG